MSTVESQPLDGAPRAPRSARQPQAPVPATSDDTTLRRVLLGAGGVLFALGNLLHPLEHNEAAEQAATWSAAHLLFGIGGVLIAAGLPLLAGRLGPGRLARAAYVLVWIGFVTMPANAYIELFVAPNIDHHTLHEIESDMTLVALPVAFAFIIGVPLLGIVGWRAGGLSRPVAAGLVLAGVTLLFGQGLPVKEGYWIIPATVVAGLALAATTLPWNDSRQPRRGGS
ncbi:hypothetical protein Ga0074812_117104 [Parafrankia irregularis]|uniref:Uncharacterized protein n=1 Tax=Parafrankia irregularis TaxID=795642 RepID=A0A0S4QRT4_9ACTN|nr:MULTISPECIES: hypothetical protein [Parafrankia]MBE3205859.1 hypothetical protein [Parafrankia sp. CH37]CUU58195.1 hypothetical protein Ga0074812_117104 [Parafrankia irregularis]